MSKKIKVVAIILAAILCCACSAQSNETSVETNETPSVETTESAEDVEEEYIEFTPPAGYTETDRTDSRISYFNDSDQSLFLHKNIMPEDGYNPLDYYVSELNATEATYGETSGVEYVSEDIYNFVFVKGSYYYSISADDKAVATEFAASIK